MKIRAFVSLEIPEAARELIVRAQQAIEGLPGVRISAASQLHVTLKFLGHVEEETLLAIQPKLSEIAGRTSPFGLSLGEAGAFPDLRRPRVVWIGLAGNLDALQRLQQDIEFACDIPGIQKEDREFHPHVTIARCERGIPVLTDRLSRTFTRTAAWTAESFHLMRSHLGAGGARHERMAEFQLKKI